MSITQPIPQPPAETILNGPQPANIVTVCAWCPELNILKLHRRDSDSLNIYQCGKILRIMRNGVDLMISHGICEPCRAKLMRPTQQRCGNCGNVIPLDGPSICDDCADKVQP